jgi:futalosine hydrolase
MNMKRILIVTAVEAEREAVKRGLGDDGRFVVITGGVGAAMAAASTASSIARAAMQAGEAYELVISAGIGGGFADRAAVGSLVVADQIIAADLGAETLDGFRSVDELGFGISRVNVHTDLAWRYRDALIQGGLTTVLGPVLTVTTVTGTAETAQGLRARIPGAAAEAMEGFGVAAAAGLLSLPVLELRAISNEVGPRDREAWRIGDALSALTSACRILREVIA